MIKSMTGFGKSSLINEQREYQMEIKSVNHRYLDISVKMPRQLSYLEETIKKEISSKVKRGKIEVYITFQDKSQDGKKIILNKELAKAYIEQLKELAIETEISTEINVIEIANLPDVFSVQANQEDEKIKQEIIELTDEALNKLIEMRRFEGARIAEDLQKRINEIKEKIIKISSISTGLIQDYIVKLEKRVKELLKSGEVDETRLAQEVVIYADKCSIEEEVTRLKSHANQFEQMLKEDIAIGKKLDFLVQEMNREINTIASKANQLDIINDVVDVKTELENIREQIQNIE